MSVSHGVKVYPGNPSGDTVAERRPDVTQLVTKLTRGKKYVSLGAMNVNHMERAFYCSSYATIMCGQMSHDMGDGFPWDGHNKARDLTSTVLKDYSQGGEVVATEEAVRAVMTWLYSD